VLRHRQQCQHSDDGGGDDDGHHAASGVPFDVGVLAARFEFGGENGETSGCILSWLAYPAAHWPTVGFRWPERGNIKKPLPWRDRQV